MVVPSRPDQGMAAVAAAQRGRISRQQLMALGMSHAMIRTRVNRETLHVLHRAVYAVGHPGHVELGRETAALLAYGDDAVLSHRSAVWLWGLLKVDPEEIHLILPAGGTTKNRPGIWVHRSGTFTAADIATCNGLPVVKPALALLQLAEHADPRTLERAVDEALATRRVSRTKLREVVAAHGRGRRGASVMAELAGLRPSSLTRSEGEERLRDLVLAAGLPTPEMNVPVHGYVADFHWPRAGYVVEFDGFAFHSSRTAWRRDRVKDRTYAAHGIRLDRFTWEDITDRPLATIAHISGQLSRRRELSSPTAA